MVVSLLAMHKNVSRESRTGTAKAPKCASGVLGLWPALRGHPHEVALPFPLELLEAEMLERPPGRGKGVVREHALQIQMTKLVPELFSFGGEQGAVDEEVVDRMWALPARAGRRVHLLGVGKPSVSQASKQ